MFLFLSTPSPLPCPPFSRIYSLSMIFPLRLLGIILHFRNLTSSVPPHGPSPLLCLFLSLSPPALGPSSPLYRLLNSQNPWPPFFSFIFLVKLCGQAESYIFLAPPLSSLPSFLHFFFFPRQDLDWSGFGFPPFQAWTPRPPEEVLSPSPWSSFELRFFPLFSLLPRLCFSFVNGGPQGEPPMLDRSNRTTSPPFAFPSDQDGYHPPPP